MLQTLVNNQSKQGKLKGIDGRDHQLALKDCEFRQKKNKDIGNG